MGNKKTPEQINEHKEKALSELSKYIDKLLSADNSKTIAKADKLCYWLEDYTRFLTSEETFVPTSRQKYKKGQILKVHLGYNIGSEEGGLHYAVVIENNNSIKSPVINIIPLTSLKESVDISNIREDRGQLYIGEELHTLLENKVYTYKDKILSESSRIKEYVSSLSQEQYEREFKDLNKRLEQLKRKLPFLYSMIDEINKMKKGSIVLVGQITTISKIRIYDPKTSTDILSGIRLSNNTLDKIDNSIKALFIKNN